MLNFLGLPAAAAAAAVKRAGDKNVTAEERAAKMMAALLERVHGFFLRAILNFLELQCEVAACRLLELLLGLSLIHI